MDIRTVRDMCTVPILCTVCGRYLCEMIHNGREYKCTIENHTETENGKFVCGKCKELIQSGDLG